MTRGSPRTTHTPATICARGVVEQSLRAGLCALVVHSVALANLDARSLCDESSSSSTSRMRNVVAGRGFRMCAARQPECGDGFFSCTTEKSFYAALARCVIALMLFACRLDDASSMTSARTVLLKMAALGQ